MSERDTLLKKIAQYDFARLELHIYLDTHPNDREAMQKLKEYNSKSTELRKEFESKYGPLTKSGSSSGIDWIAGPWPWEGE